MPLQRTTKACDICRYRKIKCRRPTTSFDTQCDACLEQGFKCNFGTPTRKRGPKGQGKRLQVIKRSLECSGADSHTSASGISTFVNRGHGGPGDSSETGTSRLVVGATGLSSLPEGSHLSEGPAAVCEASRRPEVPPSPSGTRLEGLEAYLPSVIINSFDQGFVHDILPSLDNVSDSSREAFQTDRPLSPSHVFLPFLTDSILRPPRMVTRNDESGILLSNFQRFSAIYPLITRHTFISDQSLRSESPVFQSFLLGLNLWQQCFAFKSGSTPSPEILRQATTELVRHRATYDFSLHPEAYTICTSIMLFVAHNLLEQHNRAFLYLSEAFALVSIQPPNPAPQARLSRRCAEMALYNTEMANLPLYMDTSSRKPTHLSPEIPRTVEDLLQEVATSHQALSLEPREKDAISIVIRLSQIYRASETISVDVLGEIIRGDLDEGATDQQGNDMDSLQTQLVDSKITALWQLSNLFASHDTFVQVANRGRSTENILELFRQHSTEALKWINTVQTGALRIIGLTKLTAITRNLVTLQQCASVLGINHVAYNSVLSGLARCIIQGDYEHKYSDIFEGLGFPLALGWRVEDVFPLPQEVEEFGSEFEGWEGDEDRVDGLGPGWGRS